MLVRYQTADGPLLVEVEAQPGFAPAARSAGDIADAAVGQLEESLDRAVNGAKAVVDRMRGLGPDELSVEFAIKLSAEAGAFISKVAGEAQFTVKMTWKPTS